MKLHFTSRYHPKGDRQMEWTNQTLKQYLCIYCNYQQDNWSELLPLAEFAFNNALSATTGVSPFFANKGYHPNITIHPEHGLASQHACQFTVDLDDLHTMLKTKIAEAQCRYQRSADSCQLPAPEFTVGNKVFIKAQFFWMTRPSKKLSEKYLGPYDIIVCPGTHSFMLCLPNSMCSVHPVFQVSMLEPMTLNSFPDCSDPLSAPVVVDGEPEYEISCIINSKIDRQ
jgi:hypothetical protein